MKRQRLSRITAFAIMATLSMLILIAPANAGAVLAPFGTIQGFGHHVAAPKKSVPFKEFPLSTARAQFLARSLSKGKITTRMMQQLKHRVIQPLPLKAHKMFTSPTYTTSSNWSGYTTDTAGSGTDVNAVGGAFNVSQEYGTQTASWVGIGGFYSGSLAQTGVDQYYMASWYEFLPNYPVYLYYVNANDSMYGEVALDYSTGYWYVLIWDMSTGYWYANEFSYAADQSTADWIVEVQPSGSVPYFNPVYFSYAQWIDGSGYVQDMTSNEEARLWNITLSNPVSGYTCASYPTSTESFTDYVC